MHNEYLMGNEAIGLGAIAAGVNVVSGYPGTPSTEVLETIAKNNKDGKIYVEWSDNEKAGMELAAGAALCGARALVTMKQVGLNVAADPLMSLEYLGVKGGMVVMVSDDPGPISSQTEQDTRKFAEFSKLPCFDPASVEEAYEMIQEAFEFSEKYHTPVFLRPTTRVDHGYSVVSVKDSDEYYVNLPEGFVRDPNKWVIFPRLSYQAHINIEKRNAELSDVFSDYKRNIVRDYAFGENAAAPVLGIAAQGISYAYAEEVLDGHSEEASAAGSDCAAENCSGAAQAVRVFKVATPFPFPEKAALKFLEGLDEVLCLEELDPVIERNLVYVCGKYGLKVKIRGKLTGDVKNSGENTIDSIYENIYDFCSWKKDAEKELQKTPDLPVRPPVLCPGCPHRASFYAVKQAMKGKKAVFCGDIGCYTLGNAMPLDMVDTCLCMGAGVVMAQGIERMTDNTKVFSFVGDSTFFASAITGVVNAVYNQADMTLVVLDNSTTAMTGHQPHPGTGRTMMGQVVDKVSITKVLEGIGVQYVKTVDPLNQKEAVATVKEAADLPGVKAIIFKSPCAILIKPDGMAKIDSGKCIGCKRCITTIGCPGIVIKDGNVAVDAALCTGCGLCTGMCPTGAITVERYLQEPDGKSRLCGSAGKAGAV
ncbi:MAG: indolepyruvate ferredoxin oxidoreductase subunit alpha [Lachnospiraceae bacterium]|nr:indolepyruvate ferredoxin oxidoreductase subunit alpha [Lachnospiraceae bacterium]